VIQAGRYLSGLARMSTSGHIPKMKIQ